MNTPIPTPTSITIPSATVPPVDLSDLDRGSITSMETVIGRYETAAEDLITQHQNWATATTGWAQRRQEVFGKVEFVSRVAALLIGQEPDGDIEDFTLFNLTYQQSAVITGVTVGASLIQFVYGLTRTVDAADDVVAAVGRWARIKQAATTAGKYAVPVLTIASISMTVVTYFINDHQKREGLKLALDEYRDWYAATDAQIQEMAAIIGPKTPGEEATLAAEQAANPPAEGEDPPPPGLIKELRDLSRLLQLEQAENDDPEVMYADLVTKLNEAVQDGAQAEASYRVMMRMLCRQPPFSAADVHDATNLDTALIGKRQTDVETNRAVTCEGFIDEPEVTA